jgi:TPR repeat protein
MLKSEYVGFSLLALPCLLLWLICLLTETRFYQAFDNNASQMEREIMLLFDGKKTKRTRASVRHLAAAFAERKRHAPRQTCRINGQPANRCLNFARPVLCLQLSMQKGRRTWQTFEEMRNAAEEGDPQAQCYLGVCYQNGQGTKQDYHEAVKWFKKSADQNDSVAQCYLGVCYQAGLGVPQEYGQAAKWFREAAEQGDPAAQFNLGVLYETGQGVPQNYAEAVKWYHSAAEQGEPQAQFNLGVFYEQGHVVPQNYPEAVKWYRLAAEQEVAPAQCNLGLCYQTGRGVPQSTVDAVKWFIRAARQGDKTAQHNLGVHYATFEVTEPAAETDENADSEELPR